MPVVVRNKSKFASSTAANIVRGLAPAALSAVLPLYLVGRLPGASFAVWSLGVSLGGYVVVFQVGVQQAVIAAAGRARASESDEQDALPRAAALEFLKPLLLLASGLAIAVAYCAGSIFPGIPLNLLWDFRISFLLLFAAAMASSVSSVIWGYAIGAGKLRGALISSMTGGIGSFVGAVVAAALTADLGVMALAFAIPIMASIPAQAYAVQLKWAHFSPRYRNVRRRYRRGYRKAVRTLAVWSLGMLMVTGLDGTIVGRFDFERTGVYMLIASGVSVFVAGLGSWQAAFLARAHVLAGTDGAVVIRRVARIAMVVNISSACVAAVPIWLLLNRLFESAEARLGYVIFAVLILANILRQFAVPAILSSVGAERYERLVLPAMIEGAVNVMLSIVLGAFLGAVGVAYGTLIGAIAGVTVLLGYTFRAPTWSALDRPRFVRQVLVRPIGVLLLPATASLLAPLVIRPAGLALGLQFAAAVACAWASWRFCLDGGDQKSALATARRLRQSAVRR